MANGKWRKIIESGMASKIEMAAAAARRRQHRAKNGIMKDIISLAAKIIMAKRRNGSWPGDG